MKSVVLLRSPALSPSQPFFGGIFLTERNTEPPLFVRQHVLWLKINSHEHEGTCSIQSEQLSERWLVVFHFIGVQ